MIIFIVQSINQDSESGPYNLRAFNNKEKAEAYIKLLPEVVERNVSLREKASVEMKKTHPKLAEEARRGWWKGDYARFHFETMQRINKETPRPDHLINAAEHISLMDDDEFHVQELELELELEE